MRRLAAAFADSVAEAISTVRLNPLRASLAALAMAAAVGTTAIVLTGLDGLARTARQTSARAFGADTFVVAKVFGAGLSRRELADRLARNPNVLRADLRFLERYAGDRVLYSAVSQRSADVTSGGRKFENATVNGAGSQLAAIRDVGIERGRFFTRDEELRAAQVAVIGWSVADELIRAADPIGGSIRIGGRGFTVIGVQARQGTAGGVSLDRYVWVPLPTSERLFGSPSSLQIFAKAPDPGGTSAAEDRARETMRARRQLAPGAADNFDVLTPEAARSFVANISQRIGLAGPPISFMALLAAIIVVTNTTLVSVTSRTREIGVRRAIGASRARIQAEVLIESAIVALVGGAVGLVVASGILTLASRALGTPLPIETPTLLASLGAATASGVLAGWYPARRAASFDVVTALRTE